MSKRRLIQSNMTAGAIAPTLRGRIDINKYYNGLTTAENVIILPHGGVRRRPGLAKITDSHVTEDARIEPFVFSTTQSYLILLYPLVIKIFKDGVLQSTEVSPYTTIEEVRDVDVIQSADTMILVHEDFAPRQLQRQGSDTNWALSIISLTNIPTFDFGSGAEAVWSATRGWPRTTTFHQGRLYFGGSRDKINSIWGSVVNDFFNFNVGTAQTDEAIFDTLNTDQYNAINGIFSGRHLQAFTSGGEFYNPSKLITPADSSWFRQTSYGAKKERPISVDGSTLYIDSSGRTIREFVWSFNEDSYISLNSTLISSHIINDIRSIATIRGTSTDISDFVYVVNGDGTVAVMNTMRHEDIKGWTQWTTQGTFEDVAVVGKETYFLVKRESEVFIERIQEGTFTDHNVNVAGTAPTTYNVVFNGENVTFNGDNVTWTDFSTGSPITEITTDYKEVLLNLTFKVIADGSIQDDATFIDDGTDLNHVEIDRDAYGLEVGLNYDVIVKTLPLNIDSTESGPIVNLRKRVNRVILNLYKSLGVYVMHNYLSDRQFTVVLDEAPEPFTGVHEIYLFGYTERLVEVTITQQNPLPFILLGIDSEIEY
jgi:hypothetical protein